jgi:hypothetical protein
MAEDEATEEKTTETNEDKQIFCMATLNSQLFIARRGSQRVDIHNTINFTKTGHVTVSDMEWPWSLVACSHRNCLYIGDYSTRYIHRVELADRSVTKMLVGSSPGPRGLSITRAHNLLVTLLFANKLHEYTTQGELIREISLHDNMDRPWHSIELSTGQFVVCYGSAGVSLHRVCLVDTYGHMVTSCGTSRRSADGQLYSPRCLAVDTSDQVLVSDNYKIRLFSSSLNYLGDVTLAGHKLGGSYRLHFDQINSRLCISSYARRIVVSLLDDLQLRDSA